MKQPTTHKSTVIRTDRGLSVAGTRITIYAIMDYIKADWPPELIRNWLNLTDKQMNDVLAYLETHRDKVEQEYGLVLKEADTIRKYWERRNRQKISEIAASHSENKDPVWLKIQARKMELGLQ